MWNLLKGTNFFKKGGYKLTYLRNRSRITDIENKLMVSEGETEEG